MMLPHVFDRSGIAFSIPHCIITVINSPTTNITKENCNYTSFAYVLYANVGGSIVAIVAFLAR